MFFFYSIIFPKLFGRKNNCCSIYLIYDENNDIYKEFLLFNVHFLILESNGEAIGLIIAFEKINLYSVRLIDIDLLFIL